MKEIKFDISGTGDFFVSFINFLMSQLQAKGLSKDEATDTAIDISTELSRTFSGETFYISRKPAVLARQMAIYADLQRMPHYDVDMKYGVSRGYSLALAKELELKRERKTQLKTG